MSPLIIGSSAESVGKRSSPGFIRELEILSIMHGTRNDPVSRWAQAAGDGYRPRTESIVLHRCNR
jgi:hypothetical protein